MATDIDVHDLPPSTSRPQLANGVKRSAAVFEEGRYEDPRYALSVIDIDPSYIHSTTVAVQRYQLVRTR